MTKHYPLFNTALIFICFSFASILHAQSYVSLTANNVNAGIGLGGNLFSTPTNFGLFEVPKGSGIKPLYTAALWMTGLDNSMNLHCAGQTYFTNGVDYFDGPVAISYNSAYNSFYQRVFYVHKMEIDQHKASAFPVPVSDVANSIRYWPAKGNHYVTATYGVDITSRLAPFTDVDNDGLYDPAKGDYPLICGDEAIFFVFNDDKALHTETNGLGMKIEVRGLAEVFSDNFSTNLPYEKRALNNTVFVHYEIENKSSQNWNGFSLGLFEDPDVGCFNNDRVGCDTFRNLMFAHNGSTPDPANNCNGAVGYGLVRVAHGIQFLNQKMKGFGYFTGAGANAAYSDPTNPIGFRNYLSSFWASGEPFTEGGLGHGGSVTTKHLFPGNPQDAAAWSDVTSGLPYGDRRMLGTTEFKDGANVQFTAGTTQTVDFAFITSYDSTAGIYTIVDTLKRDADEVKAFYNNVIVPSRANGSNGITNENEEGLNISIYPNPTSSQFVVEAALKMSSLELVDLSGRAVWKNNIETKRSVIDVSSLASGVYLLRIECKENRAVKKLVIE